jgi:hypothetical protein
VDASAARTARESKGRSVVFIRHLPAISAGHSSSSSSIHRAASKVFFKDLYHGTEGPAHQTPLGTFENAFAFRGSPHRKHPVAPWSVEVTRRLAMGNELAMVRLPASGAKLWFTAGNRLSCSLHLDPTATKKRRAPPRDDCH